MKNCLIEYVYNTMPCSPSLPTIRLQVPSFNGSAHLVFPALGGAVLSYLELEVVFRSDADEGILLHETHRSDASGDFLSLTVAQGHVVFTMDLGSGMLSLR